jgi:hypothetical protein
MKYKMPFQEIESAVKEIISREVKRQKIALLRAQDKHLKELAGVAAQVRAQGLPSYLVCKKLPHNLGYGIFLHPDAEPLKKGQVVGQYTGETMLVPQHVSEDALYAFEPLSNILLTKIEQKIYHSRGRYHPRRMYSLHVDAKKKGNFTRFINHSEQPNVRAELVKIPPNPYGVPASPLAVLYFVERTIRPGEQLLVSYDGDDHSYWSALDIKPFPLLSGTFYLKAGKKGLFKSSCR